MLFIFNIEGTHENEVGQVIGVPYTRSNTLTVHDDLITRNTLIYGLNVKT